MTDDIANQQFHIFFGVDPTGVTGAFVQVYDLRNGAVDDHDCAEVVIDNQGVRLAQFAEGSDKEPGIPELARHLRQLKVRFEHARASGNPRPNLSVDDINQVCIICGFTRLYNQISDVINEPV